MIPARSLPRRRDRDEFLTSFCMRLRVMTILRWFRQVPASLPEFGFISLKG
jgi:hypothetical protein